MRVRNCVSLMAVLVVSGAAGEPGITRLAYGTVNNLIWVSEAYVSDDGSVVAAATDSISGRGGRLWKREAQWISEGLPNSATGINQDGSRVTTIVSLWDVTNSSSISTDSMIGHEAISADGGVVAGSVQSTLGVAPAAASWSNGKVQLLFTPNSLSWATAINHDGSIIYFEVAVPDEFRNHWWRNGEWARLPNVPAVGTIRDCNRSGIIAVGEFGFGVCGACPGRIDDGVATQLPADQNGRNNVYSLSESGELILGFSDGGTTNTPWDDIPLIWINNDTLMTLEDFLVGEGMDLTGWDLHRATDMTPDGKFIVGGGQFNGVNSGFIIERDVGGACAADLTGDGVLDFFDISAFLTAFGALDPVADFTGDGGFDFFDISAFLSAFAAGCP